MANLVSDMINEAFADLGVIRIGETVSSAVQADAFMRLNQMWSAWSQVENVTNAQYHQALTLTAGTSKYGFGQSGTLVSAVVPLLIYGATSTQGNFKVPVRVMNFRDFEAQIEDPLGTQAVFAQILAVDNQYPQLAVQVWPVPAALPATLSLDYIGPLTAFAGVGATLALAPAFEDALHFNLAMELLPRYQIRGLNYDALAANAQASLARIVSFNQKIMWGVSDSVVPAPKGNL